MTENSPPRGPSYLRRLLHFLSVAVSEGSSARGLTEIAREAGIPLSTASRLASLLTESEMLRVLPNGGYGPGAELIRIAGNALVSLRGDLHIQTVVRSLAEASCESASAGMLVGDVIVLIAREEPGHSLRAVAHVGDSISPHTSAMGKAILANLGAERRLAVLRNAAGPEASRIQDELAGELEAIRAQGYALDEETYSPGLRCRAAAFVDGDEQAIGGISVAGPAARFSFAKATECLPMLRTMVDELSARSQTERSPAAT
ncbi:MAG TPA: IclR family transcriptional regulator [Streptosporangiaceae bacterium]